MRGMDSDPQYMWECKCNQRGYYRKTIRVNSFFESMNKPTDFLNYVYLELCQVPQKSARGMVNIQKETTTRWRKELQAICDNMTRHINVKLGGGTGGDAVEADATYFGGHKSRKRGFGHLYEVHFDTRVLVSS